MYHKHKFASRGAKEKDFLLHVNMKNKFLKKYTKDVFLNQRSVGGFLGAKCTTWWVFSLFLCCFLHKMYLIVAYCIGSYTK